MRFSTLTTVIAVCALMHLPASTYAANTTALVGVQPNGSILLPNGRTITPIGMQITVNDRPLRIAASADNTTAAVVRAGNLPQNAIQFINLGTNIVTQTINGNTFVGGAFSPNGRTLYVEGGTDNNVKLFTVADGIWSLSKTVAISGAAPSGLSPSPAGNAVYVAVNGALLNGAPNSLLANTKVGVAGRYDFNFVNGSLVTPEPEAALMVVTGLVLLLAALTLKSRRANR